MRTVEDIIPVLTKARLNGRVKWRKDQHRFRADLPNYYVLIYNWTDQNSEEDGYNVATYQNADQIDYVSAGEYNSSYSELHKFYQMVRRDALDIDSIIGKVLK